MRDRPATASLRPLLILLAFGALLRGLRFLQDWPLWWNEAFVAVNLFHRDYAGLLQPLAYRQVCPIGFLWLEKFALDRLGPSTWSLRLVPWLASLAALAVYAITVRRVRAPRAGLAAFALLAVAYHPIQLGSELKPYAVDLLAAAIVLERALAWRERRSRPAPLVHLALLSVFLMLLSYPAALVLAGTAAALALDLGDAAPRSRLAWFCWCLVVAAGGALVRSLAVPQAATASADPLNEYLRDGFPATLGLSDVGLWLGELATGRVFAFPFGSPGLASLVGLTLALVGSRSLLARIEALPWFCSARSRPASAPRCCGSTLWAAILGFRSTFSRRLPS